LNYILLVGIIRERNGQVIFLFEIIYDFIYDIHMKNKPQK
jgi:hypothetical protein